MRYCLTGCASLLTFVGVSNAFYSVGMHPTASTILAWTASALVAYFGHIHFSYRVQADHRRMLFRFMVLLGIDFLRTTGMTYLLYDLFKASYFLTTIIVGITAPLVSYPISKFWVFKEKTKTDNKPSPRDSESKTAP
ncbi:GtrA family protein [Pseudodesulfovibrio sp.]|nr:GtrA family protein [Pseudodesulfovibrio sp.]